jgi:hypothetical protein
MQIIFYSFLLISSFIACSPVKIAVEDAGWRQKEELAVKGRNGFLKKNLRLANLKPLLFNVSGPGEAAGALVCR